MVAACAACGHLGFETDPARDSGTDGALDAGEPLGPFGEPRLIAELSLRGAFDDDPSLTADLTEIYFKSDRGGGGDFDIWMAARDAPDQVFGDLHEVVELSSPAFDATPEVSWDGLTMHLSSNRVGAQGFDVFVSTRASRDRPWSLPVREADLSSSGDEFAVAMDAAGLRAVVTRAVVDRGLDLFEATRATRQDPWSAPSPLSTLSTDGWDADAHLSPDGRLVIYASDRAAGAGQRDLWIATRQSPDGVVSEPIDVLEVATPRNDEDPWLSGDGRTLVLSSDRDGDQELWIAAR